MVVGKRSATIPAEASNNTSKNGQGFPYKMEKRDSIEVAARAATSARKKWAAFLQQNDFYPNSKATQAVSISNSNKLYAKNQHREDSSKIRRR